MPNKTRDEREYELTAQLLESRQNLHAAYAIVMGAPPPAWLTDRDMIQAILRMEFPSVLARQQQPPHLS